MIKKSVFKITTIFIAALGVCFLYSCKNETKKPVVEEIKVEKDIVSPYAQLLEKTPVYKDSVYSIYITTIQDKDKILYLREGTESSIRQESKFFIHVYPTDKDLLGKKKQGNLNFDFKNNSKKVNIAGSDYYISETDLPEIDIDKINTGQYGYRGDGSINWSISKSLKTDLMQPIIELNNDAAVLRVNN